MANPPIAPVDFAIKWAAAILIKIRKNVNTTPSRMNSKKLERRLCQVFSDLHFRQFNTGFDVACEIFNQAFQFQKFEDRVF